jgi:hypothetical protein
MSPGRPEADPFDLPEEVPDDPDLDWVDPPPSPEAPDPFEAVDDDDGTPFPEEPAPERAPARPVSDDALDDDPFAADLPHPPDEDPLRPVLPWRTDAMVVRLGQTVPARLDPTAATSTWVGGPPDLDGVPLVLWLGPITLKGPLAVRAPAPGEPEGLHLGRDLLSGRVVIAV